MRLLLRTHILKRLTVIPNIAWTTLTLTLECSTIRCSLNYLSHKNHSCIGYNLQAEPASW
jgi:hypothetical protein